MSEKLKTAIQLYSVRSFPDSLPGIIRRVAEEGYDGVEFANRFQEEPPESIATVLDETDVEPVAVHAELSTIEEALNGDGDILDRCKVIDCDTLIVPHLSAREFRTRRAVRSLSCRFREISEALSDHDMRVGLHNDRRLLSPLLPDGAGTLMNETPIPERVGNTIQTIARRYGSDDPERMPSNTPLWNLIARTRPTELFFEVEVAEIRAAGYDPVATFEMFDGRAEMIHLRDVTPSGRFRGYENVSHGEGVVDMERIIDTALQAGVEWIVYENELSGDPSRKIEAGARILGELDGERLSSQL